MLHDRASEFSTVGSTDVSTLTMGVSILGRINRQSTVDTAREVPSGRNTVGPGIARDTVRECLCVFESWSKRYHRPMHKCTLEETPLL